MSEKATKREYSIIIGWKRDDSTVLFGFLVNRSSLKRILVHIYLCCDWLNRFQVCSVLPKIHTWSLNHQDIGNIFRIFRQSRKCNNIYSLLWSNTRESTAQRIIFKIDFLLWGIIIKNKWFKTHRESRFATCERQNRFSSTELNRTEQTFLIRFLVRKVMSCMLAT